MEKEQKIKPDILFTLKELSPNNYEVSTANFLDSKGTGPTPEEALENLLMKINKQFEQISKEILIATMHKNEIFKKFRRSVLKNKKLYRKKPLFFKLWELILNKFKVTKKAQEIQIFLKDKTTIESLLQKVGENLSSKRINTEKMKNKILPKTITNRIPQSPGVIFHDDAMLINASPLHKEIPIQLFLDDEGNTLDDVFPYGIVVNLN